MMPLCIFVTSVQVRNNGENNFFGLSSYYVVSLVCLIMLNVVLKDDGTFQGCIQTTNGILISQRHEC